MSTFLSTASRICIILLVLGGVVVTFTQVVGIAIGSSDSVTFAGTTLLNPVCIIAGMAGVFAFLHTYTKDGDSAAVAEDQ